MPTLAEAGLPGVEMTTWYGLFVTAGTPKDVVNRLYAETMKALQLPDVQKRLIGLGGEPGKATQEQFAALVKSDYDRFGRLIKDANVKIEPVKPTIALFTGDPAGIGPELVAQLLADGTAQHGGRHPADRRRSVVEDGMRSREVRSRSRARCRCTRACDAASRRLAARRTKADSRAGEVTTEEAASTCLPAWRSGLDLCQRGVADAMCFAPLNKAALRAGGMQHADELHYFCELLDFHGRCVEFNVLESLWTSRVTSHVPLKDVSGLLTREGVAEGVALLTRGLRSTGIKAPAHRGVRTESAQRRQRRVRSRGDRHHRSRRRACARARLSRRRSLPRRHDLRARDCARTAQGYDGVLTMYHDQGQIAMKLMGFDRGVTVPGGLPIPDHHPGARHGVRHRGRGIANTGAMQNAFALACRMGATRMQAA